MLMPQIEKKLIEEFDKSNKAGELVPAWRKFNNNVNEVLKNAVTI